MTATFMKRGPILKKLWKFFAGMLTATQNSFSGKPWIKWSAITVGGIAVGAFIGLGILWYLIIKSHGVVVVPGIDAPSEVLQKVTVEAAINSDRVSTEWPCDKNGQFNPVFSAPGSSNINLAVFGMFALTPKLKGYTSPTKVVSCLDFLKNPPPILVLTPEEVIPKAPTSVAPIKAVASDSFEVQPGIEVQLSTNVERLTDREISILVYCLPELINPTCEWNNHENQDSDPVKFRGVHFIRNDSAVVRTYYVVGKYKLKPPRGPEAATGDDRFKVATLQLVTLNQILQFRFDDGINTVVLTVSPK